VLKRLFKAGRKDGKLTEQCETVEDLPTADEQGFYWQSKGRLLEARAARENLEGLGEESRQWMLDSDFLEVLHVAIEEARHREQKIAGQLDSFMRRSGKSFRMFHPFDIDAAVIDDVAPLYPIPVIEGGRGG
jgi:hypothetical protein